MQVTMVYIRIAKDIITVVIEVIIVIISSSFEYFFIDFDGFNQIYLHCSKQKSSYLIYVHFLYLLLQNKYLNY